MFSNNLDLNSKLGNILGLVCGITFACAILSVFPWAIPDIIYSKAIAKVPAFKAMLLTLFDPLFTALWPVMFLSEKLTVSSLVGCLFILSSIICLESKQVREANIQDRAIFE